MQPMQLQTAMSKATGVEWFGLYLFIRGRLQSNLDSTPKGYPQEVEDVCAKKTYL